MYHFRILPLDDERYIGKEVLRNRCKYDRSSEMALKTGDLYNSKPHCIMAMSAKQRFTLAILQKQTSALHMIDTYSRGMPPPPTHIHTHLNTQNLVFDT